MKNILLQGGKTGLRKLFQLIPLLIMGILFYLAALYYPDLLNFIISGIKHHSLSFLIFRWGIIFTVAIGWNYFIILIILLYKLSIEQKEYLKAQRVPVVLWLIVFELLVCENVVTEFIHLMTGS